MRINHFSGMPPPPSQLSKMEMKTYISGMSIMARDSEMSIVPDGLHFTKEHEWVKVEGGNARVGITDHAQHELTEIVYVELPKMGKKVKKRSRSNRSFKV